MIKLTYLIRKRPDLGEGAFRDAWRATHAHLVERLAETLNARRYAMSRRLDTVCNTCVTKARGLADADYDGVIEIWWDSLEAYQAGVGSPPGLAALDTLIDAERRFIDFSRSSAFFTDEAVVFDRAAARPAHRYSKENVSDQTSPKRLIV